METANLQLYAAVENDSLPAVRAALAAGADPNYRPSEATLNALQKAISQEKNAIAAALLEAGGDFNAPVEGGYYKGCTAAHLAAYTNQVTLLKWLGKQGADLDHVAEYNGPPLAWAAAGRSIAAFVTLVELGADIQIHATADFADRESASYLLWALRHGQQEVAELLLTYGSQIDGSAAYGKTALHFAAEGGFLKIVQTLLARGAAINQPNQYRGEPPLYFSALNGQSTVSKFLVEHGADIYPQMSSGATLLHTAARGNDVWLVRYLLTQGFDVNATFAFGSTPLHEALSWESFDMAELLLDYGPDLTKRDSLGRTPLILARTAPIRLVKRLLDAGSALTEKDRGGATLLHQVSYHGTPELIAFLVAHGADINMVGGERRTPLHFAAEGNALANVKQLLALGANPTAADQHGYTAYDLAQSRNFQEVADCLAPHLDSPAFVDGMLVTRTEEMLEAIRQGDEAAIALLLEQGVDLSYHDKFGRTPLHTAAFYGVGLPLLLKHTAAVNAVSHYGFSPLHEAVFAQRPDIVALLLAHGANTEVIVLKGRFAGWRPLELAYYLQNEALIKQLTAVTRGPALPIKPCDKTYIQQAQCPTCGEFTLFQSGDRQHMHDNLYASASDDEREVDYHCDCCRTAYWGSSDLPYSHSLNGLKLNFDWLLA